MISIDDEKQFKGGIHPRQMECISAQNVNHSVRFLLSDDDDPLSFDVVLAVESREEGPNKILSSTIVRLLRKLGVNPK